jgi:hypothetical protein
MERRVSMFKNLKRSLNNKVSKLALIEGRQKFAPAEFTPALMAQNNYIDDPQPLETSGRMMYIDINADQRTHQGEPLAVRMMPDIPHNLDYVIVRIKCTPKQLKSSGINFKLWLPS